MNDFIKCFDKCNENEENFLSSSQDEIQNNCNSNKFDCNINSYIKSNFFSTGYSSKEKDIFVSNEDKSKKEQENNSEEIMTNKKRNRNEFKKVKEDNIFKQVKTTTLQFIIRFLNIFLIEINQFCKLKNNIKKGVKEILRKDYNISLLNTNIKIIINNYSQNDYNKQILDLFQASFLKDPNNEKLILVNKLLNKKYFEIIEIFNMTNEEFKKEYSFDNPFLLENIKCVNKKEMSQLIKYGIISYMDKKNAKKKNLDNLFK